MINQKTPLIVVVLMVKNESSSIQPTLASYSLGGLTHFFIFDTGSSDNTIQLSQDFFDQHQLTGIIQQEPFIDFATSRNHALERAEASFPDAVFFIMPDAEWYIHNPKELIHFCEQEQQTETPLYLISIKMNSTSFTTARLFRVSQHIRFKGVVHESPEIPTQTKVPDTIYFEVKSNQYGIEKSRRRWEQDLLLLTAAYNQDDQDPRTVFYLAQTYECLGKLEQAYQYYQHRMTLNGWDEENFITLFRLGSLVEQLIQHSTSPQMTWDTAMNYFLEALSLRSHRIEPLIKIANHYWPEKPSLCYFFIKNTYFTPYPKDDLLFVEQGMYTYDRYEIMSRCAWYVGDYQLGAEASRLALEALPNTPHLLRNLALYEEKLYSQERDLNILAD